MNAAFWLTLSFADRNPDLHNNWSEQWKPLLQIQLSKEMFAKYVSAKPQIS